jgi:hypothetical protein
VKSLSCSLTVSLFFVVFWVLSETGKMLYTVRVFRFQMKSGLALLFISQSPCYCLLLGEWFCHTLGRACAGRYTNPSYSNTSLVQNQEVRKVFFWFLVLCELSFVQLHSSWALRAVPWDFLSLELMRLWHCILASSIEFSMICLRFIFLAVVEFS